MTNSGNLISLSFVLLTASMYLTALLFSANSFAKESKPACEAEYQNLHKQHATVLGSHQPGTSGYFKSMHGIEDAIFVAFQNCPKDPKLFSLMGEVQLSLGNAQLAVLYANRAYSWAPDIWQSNHLIGSTLLIQENYIDALPFLEKAADLARNKDELQFNFCQASFNAKKYEKAVAACTRLVEKEQHNLKGKAYHIRAQAHRALNKNKLAAKDFDQARNHGYKK